MNASGVRRYAALLGRPFELLAPRFKIRDVSEVVLRNVRQVDPAGLKARAGDLLDTRQWLNIDLTELRESRHRRPGQRSTSRRCRLPCQDCL